MLLDPELHAAWTAQAKAEHGPVVGAIALCDDAARSHEHDRALYQGSEWAKVLQACLVAWAATDDQAHAATAIRFFTALIDDLDDIGDHRGGDEAARRDSGYAIRNLGPYTALAYDWLHDAPGMTPELRKRARARWKAWLDWYRQKGYRANTPGSNYHAGYLLAATTIAIAQAGEAPGDPLWNEVADKMWKKDMAGAFARGGVLEGGDWPEGWQYGPFSVAEISLGARIMRRAGVEIPGVARWLSALMRHHVYSLSPNNRVFPSGDLEEEQPNAPPGVMTLDAIALGDATPDDKRWARGELSRLELVDRDSLLYDALAGVGDKPVLPPRASWPTWYVAAGTGTLFARTRWDEQAVWFVAACHAAIDVDHRHPDAGNFVLSRGADDVIVDPSPYGTLSTLTSNAPTVASGHLPKDYLPSQGSWGEKTSFDFTTQRASGVVAARCDYSDQYKFQERRSDVPDALRDLVMIPSADGRDAAVIVVDRAETGDTDRSMYLRFRTPGHFALDGETGTATVGNTKLAIASIAKSSGKAAIGVPSQKDCFKEGTVRGTCDAARFPITDYRLVVAGPKPRAAHVITATDGHAKVATTPLSGDGWAGIALHDLREASVVWRTGGSGTFAYHAPPGTHVILDAPEKAGTSSVTAKHAGDQCAVEVTAGGAIPARPLVVTLDSECNVTADPEAATTTPSAGTKPSSARVRSPRAGCCGAQTAPTSPIAMAILVGFLLRGHRRKQRTRQ
ncbi:MAG: hypothetical protein JWO36_3245 [Myxococcales bacterium]|nr:hypothetical protein [Myxococcales bacterium]